MSAFASQSKVAVSEVSPAWAFAEPDPSCRPVHAVGPSGLEVFLDGLAPPTAAFLRESGFTGGPAQVALLPGEAGVAAAVLGLGDDPTSPWPYGALPFALPEGTTWTLGQGCDPAAATLGWGLGAYRFARHKAPARRPARLVSPPDQEEARILVEAT